MCIRDSVRTQLSVDDGLVLFGCRLVIPTKARKKILNDLHSSHQGIDRTKRRARQTVYWPAMTSDIDNLVSSCEKCAAQLPSHQKEPMLTEPPPQRVYEDVSVDYFSCCGRDFMVYVDRLSGWPTIFKFGKGNTTARSLISACRRMFVDLGVPIKLRCDNGPQFSSREFKQFLQRWSVEIIQSTPCYPKSNGFAESAVKTMKKLIITSTENGNVDSEEFLKALLEYRNTPREGGLSPAQIIFGHPMRSFIPAHHRSFDQKWHKLRRDYDRKCADIKKKSITNYDATAKPLQPLKIGQNVWIQNALTKKWNTCGTIIGKGNFRDYLVKLPSGKTFWRNRKFFRCI